MFKSLTFDGENSLDYGVHINGEGVYNAPERDVEMISIPGRDGDYALDHGRFHNIDVTYPAGIGEMSQTDFADKIGAFRNALASRRGYCRLEDDYHTDEFRMGVYKSGLEASPVMYNRAGEFDLVFNCKPQRFLKSGEQATEFTQSGTITNPTLFESKPLLELYGYGTLNVNGSEIVLHNDPLGDILLINSLNSTTDSKSFTFSEDLVNIGDPISIIAPVVEFNANPNGSFKVTLTGTASGTATNCTILNEWKKPSSGADSKASLNATFDDISFTAGTSKTAKYERTMTFTTSSSGLSYSGNWKVTLRIIYDGNNKFTVMLTQIITSETKFSMAGHSLQTGEARAVSSVYSIGAPLYLDCEIGEAYMEQNGVITLINKNVDIPSDLPVLSPGANTITIDNTFTKVNVIPRWWII